MIIDGEALAEKIKAELKSEILNSGKKLRLAVVKVGGDAATEKFLAQKKKFAEDVGVDVRIYELPEDISTKKLREKVSEIVRIKENIGVIVQLPLPPQINTQYILDAIVPNKDPDALSSKTRILSPVVSAIKTIFSSYEVRLRKKDIVVVGAGRLVGKPIVNWLINEGATVSVVDENTKELENYTKKADIIISGAGRPGLITSDMVKDGVVVIDAGTSEAAGKLAGDVLSEVSKKASLFTPVPGGVGPITVAMLFKNLVLLSK
jgi:methylenetetrahydrofolate dehydrogenase (NADP+) / methenyltetrahydrofolate cyclohydrolase